MNSPGQIVTIKERLISGHLLSKGIQEKNRQLCPKKINFAFCAVKVKIFSHFSLTPSPFLGIFFLSSLEKVSKLQLERGALVEKYIELLFRAPHKTLMNQQAR